MLAGATGWLMGNTGAAADDDATDNDDQLSDDDEAGSAAMDCEVGKDASVGQTVPGPARADSPNDIELRLTRDEFFAMLPEAPADPTLSKDVKKKQGHDQYFARLAKWLVQCQSIVDTLGDTDISIGHYIESCAGDSDATYKEGLAVACAAVTSINAHGKGGKARKRSKADPSLEASRRTQLEYSGQAEAYVNWLQGLDLSTRDKYTFAPGSDYFAGLDVTVEASSSWGVSAGRRLVTPSGFVAFLQHKCANGYQKNGETEAYSSETFKCDLNAATALWKLEYAAANLGNRSMAVREIIKKRVPAPRDNVHCMSSYSQVKRQTSLKKQDKEVSSHDTGDAIPEDQLRVTILSGDESCRWTEGDGEIKSNSQAALFTAHLANMTRAMAGLLRGKNAREVLEMQFKMEFREARTNLCGRNPDGSTKKEQHLYMMATLRDTKQGEGFFKISALPSYDIAEDSIFRHILHLIMRRSILGDAPLMSQEDADGENCSDYTHDNPAQWWSTPVSSYGEDKVRKTLKAFLTDAKKRYPHLIPNVDLDQKDWKMFMTHFYRRLATQRSKLGGCDRDTRNAARGEATKESDTEKAYVSKILVENAKAQAGCHVTSPYDNPCINTTKFFLDEHPEACQAIAAELLGVTPQRWPESTSSPYTDPGPRLWQNTVRTYLVFAAYFLARVTEFKDLALQGGLSNEGHWLFTHPKSPLNKFASICTPRCAEARARITAWQATRKANSDLDVKEAIYATTGNVCSHVAASLQALQQENAVLRSQLALVEKKVDNLQASVDAFGTGLDRLVQVLLMTKSVSPLHVPEPSCGGGVMAAGTNSSRSPTPDDDGSVVGGTAQAEDTFNNLQDLPNFKEMTFYNATSLWFDKGFHTFYNDNTARDINAVQKGWGWESNTLSQYKSRVSRWKKMASLVLFYQHQLATDGHDGTVADVARQLDSLNDAANLSAMLGGESGTIFKSITQVVERLGPGKCPDYDNYIGNQEISPYSMHKNSSARKKRKRPKKVVA